MPRLDVRYSRPSIVTQPSLTIRIITCLALLGLMASSTAIAWAGSCGEDCPAVQMQDDCCPSAPSEPVNDTQITAVDCCGNGVMIACGESYINSLDEACTHTTHRDNHTVERTPTSTERLHESQTSVASADLSRWYNAPPDTLPSLAIARTTVLLL